jgi:hypothetical protein
MQGKDQILASISFRIARWLEEQLTMIPFDIGKSAGLAMCDQL